MKRILTLIFLISSVGLVMCNERGSLLEKWFFDYPCPTDIEVKQNFDVEEYMGTWYNIERYQQPFQVGSDCIETSYDLFDNGTINIESYSKFLTNGSESLLVGTGLVSFPWLDPVPGKMNVSFYGRDLGLNVYILDTDYWRYSIVYNCLAITPERSLIAYYLFSRTPEFTKNETIIRHIEDIKSRYVTQEYIINTNQDEDLCQRNEYN